MDDYIVIPLTRGLVTKVDHEDAALEKVRWHANYSAPSKPYAVGRIEGRRVYMHRIITAAPVDLHVDHVNGDSLDNRRANLRIGTPAENLRNCDRSRTGGASFDRLT